MRQLRIDCVQISPEQSVGWLVSGLTDGREVDVKPWWWIGAKMGDVLRSRERVLINNKPS